MGRYQAITQRTNRFTLNARGWRSGHYLGTLIILGLSTVIPRSLASGDLSRWPEKNDAKMFNSLER